MNAKNHKTVAALAAALLLGAAGTAAAAPVDVSFTVSGTAGNWTLDFDVANNMTGTTQAVYFFGVALDARNVTGSPAGYDSNRWTAWSNAPYGGSSNVYNNDWIDLSTSHLQPGTQQNGFLVHSNDAAAPTLVDWYAFGAGSSYTGGGNFYTNSANPGFEGVATSAVPEPANVALLLAGLGLFGVMAKRRAR